MMYLHQLSCDTDSISFTSSSLRIMTLPEKLTVPHTIKKFLASFWNPKVHYRLDKSPPPVIFCNTVNIYHTLRNAKLADHKKNAMQATGTNNSLAAVVFVLCSGCSKEAIPLDMLLQRKFGRRCRRCAQQCHRDLYSQESELRILARVNPH
jgi:hypothetical protein